MTSHSIEGLSDGGLDLLALAEAVHRGRFPSDREPTPFGELGLSDTEYCYRIAKSVQQALSAAPSDGWVLVPREPTEAMMAAGIACPRMAEVGVVLVFAAAHGVQIKDEEPWPLEQAYRAMLSAAPERVEAGGWREIESAPKDGTPILIYFRRKVGRLEGAYRVEWHNIFGETTPDEGSWCVDGEKHGPYPLRGWCDGDATHWQPLPSPPIGAEGGRPTSAGVSGCGEGTQEPSPSGAQRSDGRGEA